MRRHALALVAMVLLALFSWCCSLGAVLLALNLRPATAGLGLLLDLVE